VVSSVRGPLLLIVLLVVLWQILPRAFNIPNFPLPAPTDRLRSRYGFAAT